MRYPPDTLQSRTKLPQEHLFCPSPPIGYTHSGATSNIHWDIPKRHTNNSQKVVCCKFTFYIKDQTRKLHFVVAGVGGESGATAATAVSAK